MAVQRTPLSTLSRQKLGEIVSNQTSERNIKGLARYSFNHASWMGVTFLTADELILVVGKIKSISDKGFVLREETGDWEIDYDQVIKTYAVPN